MENKNTVVVVGLLILFVGIGVGSSFKNDSSFFSQNTGNHPMLDGSMMSQNIDQHFITQMVPHHEGAIEMAKIALERSKREEIRLFAQDIIEAQTRENTDMRSWYTLWFGASLPEVGIGMMHMGSMTGDTDELKSVQASDFDREFLTQMIPHHEMAIMMANMLSASTNRPEMRTLAENIITSQSREIKQMRSWLISWFNVQ